MQYLVSVIHNKTDLASPDEEAAIDVFNDRLRRAAMSPAAFADRTVETVTKEDF
jgi:hypothetical protein